MIASFVVGLAMVAQPITTTTVEIAPSKVNWEVVFQMSPQELGVLHDQLLQQIISLNQQIKDLITEIKNLRQLVDSGTADESTLVRLEERRAELYELRLERYELKRLLRYIEYLLEN